MTTCGMYDFAGDWVYRVGMPAKSGVGGGIIAVLPGQLGIGVFSPALDERGNSVRGVAVCEAMSAELGSALPAASARLELDRARELYAGERAVQAAAATPPSGPCWTQHGRCAVVYELQGDLRFATIEPLLREIERRRRLLALRADRLQARHPCRRRRRCAACRTGRLLRRTASKRRADAGAARGSAGRVRLRAGPALGPAR